MPALVLPNGTEIEIYDAGSAVSPIDDGMYIWDSGDRKRGRFDRAGVQWSLVSATRAWQRGKYRGTF